MKSLLTKIFGPVPGGDTNTGGAPPGPPLDSKREAAASMPSLREHQKCALAGWIAEKLALQLHADWPPGALLQTSLSESPPQEGRGRGPCFLHKALRLVEAVERQEDVYLTIREMNLPDEQHRLLLELYEDSKEEIRRYLPSRLSVEPELQEEEDETWQIYRDVIYAATQMKFLLIRRSEIVGFLRGKLLCEVVIKERGDIPKARDAAKTSLLGQGLTQTTVMSQLLVISEAVTNILKHADDGTLTIVKAEAAIHILVQDRGPGFPLKLLPNTTLIAGYSTKKSLGQGFTLMMKMADRVLLSTSSKGSALILIFNEKESRNLHVHNE